MGMARGYVVDINNGETEMTYEFQNTLFRSADDMCGTIATEWMTAGGLQKIDFTGTTPAKEAADCIAGWGLDADWMEARGIDKSEILRAFEEIA